MATDANWVAHLASIHLGAAHVSIVESASLSAAVQAGVIDLAIGARKSLDDIPPSLKRVEFDCDPARPLETTLDAPPADEASAARSDPSTLLDLDMMSDCKGFT